MQTHSGLEEQFTLFSRFGSIGSDGINITLSQSDMWLKQAGIIDGWNITTTDTAIAFRKFSRGSTRLGFMDGVHGGAGKQQEIKYWAGLERVGGVRQAWAEYKEW